jgi:ABC-type phosphate/phosphonate transport system permease subunit
MIGTILGIILCVFFGFFAIGAMVLNYEEHERRRKKKND